MLIGLVTKNAILLVDRSIANLKERNMPLREALIEAGEARLRPIVMTTLAMVFGMMPIAFGGGAGNEWKSDRKSTRLNSSHEFVSRMPSSA